MLVLTCAIFLCALSFWLFRKLKFKRPWLFGIIGALIPVVFFILSPSKNPNGYEGDLVPIKSEIDNISGYEEAVKLISDNSKKLRAEEERNTKLAKERLPTATNVQDSLYKILKDRKLRFPGFTLEIEGKDTTITFEGSRGDYYMRGNHKDKQASFTIFKHSIFYTTEAVKEIQIKEDEDDTPGAIIKIKPKYYYTIASALEY
ncbi:hypothetical protein [Chryseobacterium sp. SIMBA_029]|uniref:hypothetical protein n=1 Tax=Chryseobacterium sp. SIMBA_029 TaxID=3085772 RepID=UPI003979A872